MNMLEKKLKSRSRGVTKFFLVKYRRTYVLNNCIVLIYISAHFLFKLHISIYLYIETLKVITFDTEQYIVHFFYTPILKNVGCNWKGKSLLLLLNFHLKYNITSSNWSLFIKIYFLSRLWTFFDRILILYKNLLQMLRQ